MASIQATGSNPARHDHAALQALLDRLIGALIGIRDEDSAFLVGIVDGRRYDIKSWDVWDWTQGVGLYGLVRTHERTGDANTLDLVRSWFGARLAEPPPPRTINTVAPVYALAHLAAADGDAALRALAADWAAWVMNDLPRTTEGGFQHIVVDHRNEGQLWDDSLMMTALPLARAGLLLNRPDYVEEAVRQFLVHTKYLADRATGLWFHGWSFVTRDHLSAALWARGNSWVTMAIPDLIELIDLPRDGAVGAFLIETLRAQVAALAACQRDDGLWPTLLDDPDSYGEASATAGFAYGILKGVRLGLLDPSYAPCGARALDAVVANIDPVTGALGNVSFGTPIFATREEYARVPLTTMPYGQAMAILALDEGLRAA
ncbi:glycoside hydrolase family 88 protein [Sphingomonas sp.]|uniref:beta-galactosidase BglB n=1 Tax=Sphingomonas sp. TaxID=28214 RepID=UPI0026013C2C|nr:glycoside hydrolase family 88 protein [Sphingomonas sp.]